MTADRQIGSDSSKWIKCVKPCHWRYHCERGARPMRAAWRVNSSTALAWRVDSVGSWMLQGRARISDWLYGIPYKWQKVNFYITLSLINSLYFRQSYLCLNPVLKILIVCKFTRWWYDVCVWRVRLYFVWMMAMFIWIINTALGSFGQIQISNMTFLI